MNPTTASSRLIPWGRRQMTMSTGNDRPDGMEVVQQDQYEEETSDTTWVELQDGSGAMEVREIPPLRLLRDMKQYGVLGLMQGDDDVDAQAMLADGGFTDFIENTVLPNVVTPRCYWSRDDADDIGDGDFDLAALTMDDLMLVITAMTGQDADELEEQMDETFRG